MKRFGAAACTFLLAGVLLAAGCNDLGNTFQGNTGAVISTLSPSNISAGGPDFTLTVNGAGFVAKTVVQWNGANLASTAVTDTAGNVLYMTATVPAALTAKPGTAYVSTLNPHSSSRDNGLSNPVAFVINPPPNPVPVVNSISPASAAPGTPGLTLTVTGSSFIQSPDPADLTKGSVVRWNSGAVITTLLPAALSGTQIQVNVSSALLKSVGCATVSVFNPPAPGSSTSGVPNPSAGGGGTSANTPTFTISTNPNFCPAPAVSANLQNTANIGQSIAEETPSLSADGRFVAFTATQDGIAQTFVRDTCLSADSSCRPATSLSSMAEDGSVGNADSSAPSISSDGRYVAFSSAATNLLAGVPVGRQIYLRDTCAGVPSGCSPSTQLVSRDDAGQLSGADNILPSISSSGRFIAFLSVAYSKYPQSQNSAKSGVQANSGLRQIFIRDTCIGAAGSCVPATTRVSVLPGDTHALPGKPAGPALSGSASAVAISGAGSATVFSHSVAVDDRVFLAITRAHQ